MQLLLMRHGEAEPFKADDKSRNLTPYGVEQARRAGDWLNAELGSIDVAMVSPYVRAQQTLTSLAEQVNVSRVMTNYDITPSGNPSLVHDYVDAFLLDNPDVKSLLLVCHMPIVSFLTDNFCQQHQSMLFATSAIVNIDYEVNKSKGAICRFYNPV
ncbi:phosphohistidine phosphatase SixA [Paraneptunicella aestuarii]|uniref:phosphohistidine phosphatase SixA n=1 Tax=Paraneptunicella aestuarii TaxID=2831148 RepID=UPI001E394D05|nr:phosphohistidine phosphatase SixA [Paraneptunicella aestuarii]UAA40115.1 phosphohistidine phosphatase SixA [Paraneptunicella aestuarii]